LDLERIKKIEETLDKELEILEELAKITN